MTGVPKTSSVARDLAERWLGEDGDLSSDEISVLAREHLRLEEQFDALREAVAAYLEDLDAEGIADDAILSEALTDTNPSSGALSTAGSMSAPEASSPASRSSDG